MYSQFRNLIWTTQNCERCISIVSRQPMFKMYMYHPLEILQATCSYLKTMFTIIKHGKISETFERKYWIYLLRFKFSKIHIYINMNIYMWNENNFRQWTICFIKWKYTTLWTQCLLWKPPDEKLSEINCSNQIDHQFYYHLQVQINTNDHWSTLRDRNHVYDVVIF